MTAKLKKSYTYEEYLNTFFPWMCRACENGTQRGILGGRRICPECGGTGRKGQCPVKFNPHTGGAYSDTENVVLSEMFKILNS